jgi:hypothetical protein
VSSEQTKYSLPSLSITSIGFGRIIFIDFDSVLADTAGESLVFNLKTGSRLISAACNNA